MADVSGGICGFGIKSFRDRDIRINSSKLEGAKVEGAMRQNYRYSGPRKTAAELLYKRLGASVNMVEDGTCCRIATRRQNMRTMSLLGSFEPFNTYGWTPNAALSEDENYMDLVLLVTRSSKLKQGSMACILVRANTPMEGSLPTDEPLDQDLSVTYFQRVISVSTNQSLYKENESDIHAEIAAIGQAARGGRSTDHCTAYITMPPCRRCFAALLSAGVRRIISRHASPLIHIASQHDIEMNSLKQSELDEQRARVDGIVLAFVESQENEHDGDDAADKFTR